MGGTGCGAYGVVSNNNTANKCGVGNSFGLARQHRVFKSNKHTAKNS